MAKLTLRNGVGEVARVVKEVPGPLASDRNVRITMVLRSDGSVLRKLDLLNHITGKNESPGSFSKYARVEGPADMRESWLKLRLRQGYQEVK